MWRKKRTFFSHLFKPTFSCLFYSCLFSPHPELSPPLKLLGQIYGQANLDYVKCIFNVEQVSCLLIFSIFYKSVVHFCGIVVIHRATCDGWVPSCWRCHRRSWAKLIFPREKCSAMSAGLSALTHLICGRLLAIPWMQYSLLCSWVWEANDLQRLKF